MISICEIHIYIDSERFRKISWKILPIAASANWDFKIEDVAIFVFFWRLPIDFQIGLPLNINGNDGQNRSYNYMSRVHIDVPPGYVLSSCAKIKIDISYGVLV